MISAQDRMIAVELINEAKKNGARLKPACQVLNISEGFASLEESRIWVDKFVKWYNHEYLHSGINFLSPYQRHFGLDKEIMGKRIKTYEEAKLRNPERWSGEIRDWSLPEYVALNPMSEAEVQEIIGSKK